MHVMSEPKHYIFNSKTLSYEVKTRSAKSRVFKTLALFVVSLGMAVLYFWIYVQYGLDQRTVGLQVARLLVAKKFN